LRSVLAAGKSIGRGRVGVSVLWQKPDPLANTSDRAVLDAWLLWAVRENENMTKGVRP
jgi:hypothetical protein